MEVVSLVMVLVQAETAAVVSISQAVSDGLKVHLVMQGHAVHPLTPAWFRLFHSFCHLLAVPEAQWLFAVG